MITIRCRPALAAAVAVASATPRLHAQIADTVLGNRLVARHVWFGDSALSFMAFLTRGAQYRIAIWPASTGVKVVGSTGEDLFAPRVLEGGPASATHIELYPSRSETYRFTVAPPAHSDSVLLWLWEDTVAEARSRTATSRRWRIGFDAIAGAMPGYWLPGSLRAPGLTPFFAGGLVLSSASPFWLNLGFGNETRPGFNQSVTWGFAEARFRAHQWKASRLSALHVVLRIAQGNSSSGNDPSFSGLGVLLTRHLDHRDAQFGWMVGAELLVGSINNVGPAQKAASFELSLSWLP
ncbi:MAG: hypothetical protein ACREL5_11330 [Gemmatimonadales bacterium]